MKPNAFFISRAAKSALICERASEEGFRNYGKFEEGVRRKKIETAKILGEEKKKNKEKND